MVGSKLLTCRFQKKEGKVAWVALIHSIRLVRVLLATHQVSSLQPGGTLPRQTPTVVPALARLAFCPRREAMYKLAREHIKYLHISRSVDKHGKRVGY